MSKFKPAKPYSGFWNKLTKFLTKSAGNDDRIFREAVINLSIMIGIRRMDKLVDRFEHLFDTDNRDLQKKHGVPMAIKSIVEGIYSMKRIPDDYKPIAKWLYDAYLYMYERDRFLSERDYTDISQYRDDVMKDQLSVQDWHLLDAIFQYNYDKFLSVMDVFLQICAREEEVYVNPASDIFGDASKDSVAHTLYYLSEQSGNYEYFDVIKKSFGVDSLSDIDVTDDTIEYFHAKRTDDGFNVPKSFFQRALAAVVYTDFLINKVQKQEEYVKKISEQANETIAFLGNSRKILIDEIDRLRKHIMDMGNKYLKKDQKIYSLTRKLARQSGENASYLRQELSELQDAIKYLQDENEALRTQNKQVIDDLDRLREKTHKEGEFQPFEHPIRINYFGIQDIGGKLVNFNVHTNVLSPFDPPNNLPQAEEHFINVRRASHSVWNYLTSKNIRPVILTTDNVNLLVEQILQYLNSC